MSERRAAVSASEENANHVMEVAALEPKAVRIARYKAERRRQLAEKYGIAEELHVRKEGGDSSPTAAHGLGVVMGRDLLDESAPLVEEIHSPNVSSSTHSVGGTESRYTSDDPGDPCDSRNQPADPPAAHACNVPQLQTRVSVGHLRNALMQQTCGEATAQNFVDGSCVSPSLDLAMKPRSEGRRRPRRYLPGGDGMGRKTSERFRTQPVTAGEMQETSGSLEINEVEKLEIDAKTDDRAKMSVAAKMSLFKELEKTAGPEISSLLRPRSSGGVQERRVRCAADRRPFTQPVTNEDVLEGASVHKAAAPGDNVSKRPSLDDQQPGEEDESAKLSMSEKLALFTKLAQTADKAGPVPVPPERRRQKGSRFRTQPITLAETNLLPTGSFQLPPLHLSSQLSDRQEALSINLKPSEIREHLLQPGTQPEESHPTSQASVKQENSKSGEIKGILKKSGESPLSVCHMTVQKQQGAESTINQQGLLEMSVQDLKVGRAAQGAGSGAGTPTALGDNRKGLTSATAPVSTAPWRQRGSTTGSHSREHTRTTLSKQSEEMDNNLEGNQTNCDRNRSVDQHNGTEGELRNSGIDRPTRLSPAERCSRLQDDDKARKEKVDNDIASVSDVSTICWEPVLSSIFTSPNSASYVIRYNQTTHSYEAQEVPPAPQRDSQNALRQKRPATELQEAERAHGHQDPEEQQRVEGEGASRPSMQVTVTGQMDRKAGPEYLESSIKVRAETVKELTTLDSEETSGCFFRAVTTSTISSSVSVSNEQDFGVIFHSDIPKLISAVAEHKRAVRPNRKTQASRNPLRALAARDDIRLEYTEQRVDVVTMETERIQVDETGKHSNMADTTPSRLSNERNVVDIGQHRANSTKAEMSDGALPFSELMLIHVKGRQYIQARLVEPVACSLHSGDCFLLVTPMHCFLWNGVSASIAERAKASEVASHVLSKRNMGCQAPRVTVLEEGDNSDSSLAREFWSLLGGRVTYRGAGRPDEDEAYESGVVESNCVYRLVTDRLVPVEEAWASMPSVSLLGSAEVLVFDFGTEVYVWYGSEAPLSDRKVALQLARQVWAGPYDYSNCRVNPLDPLNCNPGVRQHGVGRPSWVLFGLLTEHNETALFRGKFRDWAERNGTEENGQAHPLQLCDVKALLIGGAGSELWERPLPEGQGMQKGRGLVAMEDGRQVGVEAEVLDVWHVRESGNQQLAAESVTQFHEGDAYVVCWKRAVTGREGPSCGTPGSEHSSCFLWQGRHSPFSGKRPSSLKDMAMDDHKGAQVRVLQGREPPSFLQLFQGGLVIHRGSRQDSADKRGCWRMFCARGEIEAEASLMEVECCCASLRSRGSIVLLGASQGALYLWHGCKSHSVIRKVARRAVERLTLGCPTELGLSSDNRVRVQEVDEGVEPVEFWHAIGQPDRKTYDCMLQDPGKYNFTPRLFHLSASSGVFKGEELVNPTHVGGVVMAMPFLQENLYSVPQPALFLLDNCMEVYLWQSFQPVEMGHSGLLPIRWDEERKVAMEMVLQYCKERNPRRPPEAYLVQAGSEPLTFTNIFPQWEWSPGPEPQGGNPCRKVMLVRDALAGLNRAQYPAEELLGRPMPNGVDPLSDRDSQAGSCNHSL